MKLPDTPDIKLVVMHIDKTGNNHAGTLINTTKIQTINNNQALYTIQLDEKMTGLNLITGKSSTNQY
ncbi:MAG: hypothetical protein ACE5SW_11425 [Nitrososphaeraceae archaeon]